MLSVRPGYGDAQTPRFPAVVDTGSPDCIFRWGVGEYVGINIPNGIQHVIGGIISEPKEPIYFHRVKLDVELHWVVDVMAGFVRKLAGTGILGRNGFLDAFTVMFDHSKRPPEMEVHKIELIH
jgi:hypothetical protein